MLLEKGKISGMLDKINVLLDDLNKKFQQGRLCVMFTNNFCLIELDVFTLGNPVSSHSLIMSVN